MKLYDVIRKEQGKKKDMVEEIALPQYDAPKSPRAPFGIKKLLVLGGAVAFLAVIYLLGMKLVRARVIITERHIPFSIAGAELELTHEKDADPGRLSFQAMVVSTEVTREVFGSELHQSTSKAKGKAVIFNEYSKTAQTIKVGTTLTSTAGKKYVTQSSVSVPGYTMTGKVKNPGTATVAIVASDVGETYNTDSTSFVVTGWTGTKAKQLYARSAGSITGGEAGMRHSLSPKDLETVKQTLQAQLIERLKRESRAQIPDNLITFPELQVATIDMDSLKFEGEGIKFPATLGGSMVSYLIPRDLLEQSIAKRAISDKNYTHVSIPALGDIKVVPLSALPTDPARIPETITVSVTGQSTIIAKVPQESLRESLVGTQRRNFDSILAPIPEIDSARYILYPFWAPYFPINPDKISIEIK